MPASSTSSLPKKSSDLPSGLLSLARPFLRGELEAVDPALPSLVSTLRSVGAGECWHKHGTFLAHLLDVHRILTLWGAPRAVSLCGLFHSAYSNSYVNLAIFDPATSRGHVASLLGPPAERLVHLFCVVDRQALIHDRLLFAYSPTELALHLAASQSSLADAREKGVFDRSEPWRAKLNSLVPAEGVTVKHIRTGEDVVVSRRVVATFLMMTMADFSDQLFGFQDDLFDNDDGKLEFRGNSFATALWPGDGRPGLWLNSVSRMGAVYMLMVREEEIYLEERRKRNDVESDITITTRDEEIELVVPPVFERCTKVLDATEQRVGRDLYWEAVGGAARREGLEEVERLLVESIGRNPFVGEPHVVLGQVYLGLGRYEEAEEEAEEGLRLILEWGSGWDKRVSWEGWVSWARVLLMKAREKEWPQTSWGILNLGLVK